MIVCYVPLWLSIGDPLTNINFFIQLAINQLYYKTVQVLTPSPYQVSHQPELVCTEIVVIQVLGI